MAPSREGGIEMGVGPSYLWWLSCRAHARRIPLLPRILKFINFFFYHAILPPEAILEEPVRLQHYALGVVIHPNTRFGRNITIYHQVTIAAETWIGSPHQVQIGNDVLIGAGAKIVPRPDTGLVIGHGARIGANAVVTRNVPDGATVAGVPATDVRVRPSQHRSSRTSAH